MDSDRFDLIAKLLARGVPRRGAVVAAALAGLGLAGVEDADAKKKKKKKKKKNKPCKQAVGSCTSESQCCGNLVCQDVPDPCPEQGTYCCGLSGEDCRDDCDCCGNEFCSDGKCCGRLDDPCLTTEDCCTTFTCNGQSGKCEVD